MMKTKHRNHLRNRPYVKQILALFICFLLFAPNIPAAAAEGSANNRTVKAGVFFFDGYHMRDDDGSYTGYGIELLNLISQYSHLNFEFVGYDNTWEEMQSMLLSGEIDVVTSARKTRARTEIFGFSDPIEHNSTVLSVLEENTTIIPGDYSTYNGMTVGLLAGSSQNRTLPVFAEENGFTYQTREYEYSSELEEALRSGEIDAILTSNLRRTEGERVLDTTNIDYFYAITRKDDQELLDEINYALSQMNLHEGDFWANNLYNKYYGDGDSSSTGNVAFTQREQDYIEAVVSGEKHITVTALPDRIPYSYAENGELKGILPLFFDRLMKIAGLPYEVIVPKDNEDYEQLKKSGGVDVVIDWQSSSIETGHVTGGFLTNTYMNTGTTLVTRKSRSGPISSLAVLEGLVGLPLEHERFQNARIQAYSSPKDVVQAVLDGEADAAFMRTYTAQYFVNNDSTNSLKFDMVDSDQVVFNLYIPISSDHELVNILNKCIQQVPDDVLSQLITEYTAVAPENMTLFQYMAAHPEMAFPLFALAALAIGVVIFFYLRAWWNNMLLRTTQQTNQKLEEQLAIVNALSRDYFTVYKLDMNAGTLQALKTEGYMPSGVDWKNGEVFPYTEALRRYGDAGRVLDEDKADLAENLSLDRLRKELSANPEYMGTYRVREGEEIHSIQFVCVAYQIEGQPAPHVLLGFRNIDEIVRKEQKQKAALEDALHMARAASEAKTAFLSSMSHDIRTPMNAIIGFLTLMRDEVDHPEAVREYIQRIDAASHHLLGLINDVLDMNKIESGSTTLSLAEMNLAEVIAEINTIIQPQAKAKNQSFEISVSHLKFECLLGDRMRINQILINLLSNAVKYTPDNGAIEMRVEELPQVVNNYSRIRFTVSDNGLGMSEDYQKVIFDPFTREDTGVTHEIQGTGLGMAITKRLVDLMGGTIEVDSTLGEGSTFVVELELPIREQENDPRFWADHHITRMLVVDDDEEVCRNVVRTMAAVGVSTDCAAGGEGAVRMVREVQEAGKPYDLILLDWKMPGMNGLEAARLIRSGSKTPILLLTSYDWREIEREAVEIGIDHFMPKPFFMSTFKEAVRLMLDRAKETKHQESDVVRGMNILVVDDIEVNRIILVKILNTLGAGCDTASNGREAVEKFMGAPSGYDLILMDVQMPEMNGYEATRAIRASGHPFAKAVPIVAMTANAFVDDVRDAIDSGMDAHIAKPVQIDNLKATIQQVLDNRAEAEGL